jgi:hypothetical protein
LPKKKIMEKVERIPVQISRRAIHSREAQKKNSMGLINSKD